MNYDLYFVGFKHKVFDEILKLLIISAKESDYLVENHSYAPENLKSPRRLLLKITGSLKKESKSILIDFDNLSISNMDFEIINRKTIGLQGSSGLHYWKIIGYLMKNLQDISPAYFTGYLVENKMEEELEAFRNYFHN
jgi:hypothetical protein